MKSWLPERRRSQWNWTCASKKREIRLCKWFAYAPSFRIPGLKTWRQAEQLRSQSFEDFLAASDRQRFQSPLVLQFRRNTGSSIKRVYSQRMVLYNLSATDQCLRKQAVVAGCFHESAMMPSAPRTMEPRLIESSTHALELGKQQRYHALAATVSLSVGGSGRNQTRSADLENYA